MPDQIGRYRITRKLGEGGMGVVYEAKDEGLDRAVALKVIREDVADEQACRRFRREAKTAASVSHPNVCQLFEIGEEQGALFIVMELLTGESLADRIGRGPLPVTEAAPVALGVLSALTALHGREIVHRDLKPSNVFLTPHGVKLLDFGLARPQQKAAEGDGQQTMSQLTQAGLLVGTPRYMAPEQVRARAVDARTDLFAMGAILFEMLTGRPPFRGGDMVEILYAIAHEQPPALTGSAAIEAVDRVVRRALAKKPDDRYADAAAMAQDLREALLLESSGGAATVRTMTRLIVLPFRILRADADTDFLAFSLPDAITAALSGLGSLVVRSSLAAARFADVADLKRIASEADVDAVLTGTILRAGEKLRVSTQLVEAPAGTLIWSHTTQATLTDIFQVQDDLVHRIVDSLSTPLTAREHKRLNQQLPSTGRAYELYLRANQLAQEASTWATARELYERCLEEDGSYAPAWARLGRVYRLLSKYGIGPSSRELLGKAQEAFRRAVTLDPDLSLAHNLSAQLDVEAGRTKDVLVRLLARTKDARHDAEVFAALVHVCRYCGLLDASLAADRRARSLDPNVRTSAAFTYWMRGEYERAAQVNGRGDEMGFMQVYVALAQGRKEEGLRVIAEWAPRWSEHMRAFADAYAAAVGGDRAGCAAAAARLPETSSGFRDGEGLYLIARALAYVGENDGALGFLERVAAGGFFCFPTFVRDPWLDGLRSDGRFQKVMREAEERHREAEVAFIEAGGERLLA